MARSWGKAGLLLLAGALTACGGGDGGGGSPPAASVTGTVAVGDPLIGATVSFQCKSGAIASVTTVTAGAYTAPVGTATLPCAIRVSGGTAGTAGGPANTQTLFSLATQSGATHVTPLTTLILAKAVQMSGAAAADLATWYSGSIAGTLQSIATNNLSDAIGVLNSLMTAGGSGYSWPTTSGFNPFTASGFSPVAGNAYDDLLEELRRALEDQGLSLEDLATTFLTSTGTLTLPVVPEDDNEEPGSGVTLPSVFASGEYGVRVNTTGTVDGNAESDVLRVWSGNGEISAGSTAGKLADVYINSSSPAGSFGLKDIPDTVGTHPCGGGIGTAAISLGYMPGGGYSSLGTSGVSGFRCSLTITSVGARDGSNYSGVIEGTFDAQLFKTGAAVNLATSVSVAGRFRIGTPVSNGGGGYDPVAKARTFIFTDDKAAVRAEMVGEYDVAIYAAPEGGVTGKGKLEVAYADETLTLTLKNAAGAELIKRSGRVGSDYNVGTLITEDQYAADPAGVYESNGTPGRRTGVYNYFQGGSSTGPSAYFAIDVFSNGVIAGSTAGYYFRNEVTAYGPTIPSVFTALAGSYSGTTQQVTCSGANPLVVGVTAAGAITAQGKASLSCTIDRNHSVTWDGQQDLLVPSGTGSRLVLDALNIGGSAPDGGYFITLNSSTPPGISKLSVNFSGAQGDLTSVNLVKQ